MHIIMRSLNERPMQFAYYVVATYPRNMSALDRAPSIARCSGMTARRTVARVTALEQIRSIANHVRRRQRCADSGRSATSVSYRDSLLYSRASRRCERDRVNCHRNLLWLLLLGAWGPVAPFRAECPLPARSSDLRRDAGNARDTPIAVIRGNQDRNRRGRS
jgi:hypothetical protein